MNDNDYKENEYTNNLWYVPTNLDTMSKNIVGKWQYPNLSKTDIHIVQTLEVAWIWIYYKFH